MRYLPFPAQFAGIVLGDRGRAVLGLADLILHHDIILEMADGFIRLRIDQVHLKILDQVMLNAKYLVVLLCCRFEADAPDAVGIPIKLFGYLTRQLPVLETVEGLIFDALALLLCSAHLIRHRLINFLELYSCLSLACRV